MSGVSKEHRAAQAWDEIELDIKSRLPKLLKKSLDSIENLLEDKKISHSTLIRTAEFLLKIKNDMKKEEIELGKVRPNSTLNEVKKKLAPIISLTANK